MTSFKYEPISLEGPAFRLLRLLKGTNEPIQGQLFESKLPSLDDARDYAALSYTWGSQSRPCEIMINGCILAVTKNAYLALRDLRYHDKDRILWIDALCINQNDDKERGEQVQQMGSIYSKAERVVIWLGEATYDTDYLMYYMKQLEKAGTKNASNSQVLSDEHWVNTWSAVAHELSVDQVELLAEGVQSLLCRDWFNRVWIIQEVANAEIAEVVCGSKSVSASVFTLTLSLLKITPHPHCQSILDIMPGALRNSSWWANQRDLYTLLVKFRESKATDPRDSIYALLGISSDACDTDRLKVNYEKDIQDVIFDTVSFLLDFSNLDSLSRRFLVWTLPEFLRNLSSLANEVLKCAINAQQVTLVKLLIIRNDVDINMNVSGQTQLKVSGRTPLSWAAERGHEMVINLLLDKGAELETRDSDRRTALSLAAGSGHAVVAKLLLENGADIDAGEYYRTPLYWAAIGGHETVVQLLLEKGAETDIKGRYGRMPLSHAAESGHETVVKLLLENGAELDLRDEDGGTPLLWAAKKGHKAVVKLLLDKGAQPKIMNKFGETPLSWAAATGHEAVVKLLLEKGAELEAKGNGGHTPLHLAAGNGQEEVVKLLLEKGAELGAKDKDGRTPLLWAAERRREAVVKLLLEKGAK